MRNGTIEEHSNLFGAEYQFDYRTIRKASRTEHQNSATSSSATCVLEVSEYDIMEYGGRIAQ
ncbi:MAG: hypothetical protein ABDK87_07485, partial [Atribacterota bacterium]